MLEKQHFNGGGKELSGLIYANIRPGCKRCQIARIKNTIYH